MQGAKKRKQDADVEAERTLYGSFVHAANAVSQLYTQAQQQHNRSKEEGARLALVSPASSRPQGRARSLAPGGVSPQRAA